MEWVTILGNVVAAQQRTRGPEHRQMVLDRNGRWSAVRWEYRSGAWHEEAAQQVSDQVGTVNGLDRHPPVGVKVSRPATRARQVELSHRQGRGHVTADPEGYAR
jgi:hypothetical protein